MVRVPKKSLAYKDGHQYYNGVPFTGAAYFKNDKGEVTAEIEYRDGLEWGKRREWTAPGKLSLEDTMWLGVIHGKSREWFLNGKLADDRDYELGILVRQKSWDKDGNLTEEYEMQETDPEYKELEDYRKIYTDAPPVEDPIGGRPKPKRKT